MKESYARDHFRYIFNRIFNCQPGHVYDLPKVIKVGKHYELNGIRCYKYLKESGPRIGKREPPLVEIFIRLLYFGTDHVEYKCKIQLLDFRCIQKRFKFFFHSGCWSPQIVFQHDDLDF